ncbi:CopG family transcriptional regulator [Fischerella muscicola CCMEE 5323]|uniref:CopG family transcriptional regulator n=1 Tax=Fischerella muscicola CCMEE 5323 TaxID=2019572 RepID=A0A2N6K5E5_FISMU|nr:CopG family transcriptional regulator [Fischerella muscicola]PLZ91710.1 CopG family transcriptional regulator [Fischerella muscicola CCMEE 5323]
MGGKTDLDRVVAYIPSEWKKELEEWAQIDERSVSWLVAKLIDKALQERRKQQNYIAVIPLPDNDDPKTISTYL